MKRIFIVLIAFLLIIMGASVCLGALVAIDFNFDSLEGVDWVEKVYTVEGEFSSVLLTLGSDDLTVLPSEDGTCRFVCQETDKYSHDVQVRDGALHITERNSFRWYDRFFSFTSPRATLYLPQGIYALSVKIGSGDVTCNGALTFTSLDVTTGSGDVILENTVSGSLEITTGSGDVALRSVNAQSIALETGSGDTELSAVHCDTLTTKSGSGDLDALRLLCTGELSMQTGSGDIHLALCDAASLSLSTGSGDVEGTLLSPKTFRVQTGSGETHYPSTQGGLCEVTTQSGDVEFSIASDEN